MIRLLRSLRFSSDLSHSVDRCRMRWIRRIVTLSPGSSRVVRSPPRSRRPGSGAVGGQAVDLSRKGIGHRRIEGLEMFVRAV
jgi:hypothetical protein